MKTIRRLMSLLLALAMLLPMALPAMPAEAVEMAETFTELATETAVVESAVPGVSQKRAWDFSDASQLSDFSLYQSASSQFSIVDGMLAPNGTDGEMKAILTQTPENLKSVSVEIHPGPSGNILGGLYFGASNATNALDSINAQILLIQSNYTGWSDAPNRIDIVQGMFDENGWNFLGATLTETGSRNNLFSGGVKQPLKMELLFGADSVLMTLSLVSNPDKNIQLIYAMDPTDLVGQIGLRSSHSDTRFDNLQVEYERPLTEYEKLYDFSDSAQAEDFDFYASGESSLSVADGMLKPNGSSGEMKAIFNEDMANIASVSVNVFPGATGKIDGGVYVGANNIESGHDQIDSLVFMLESAFTGWDDAPNRVDLVYGKYTHAWSEISRTVTETNFNNNFFTGGVKQPLNLKLDFGEATITVTLSLVYNPSKSLQIVYDADASDMQGKLGLRANFCETYFDDLIITYKEPIEQPVPEEKTVYANDGYLFMETNIWSWELTKPIYDAPYTMEAWVKIPKDVADSKTGYIMGNAPVVPYACLQLTTYGRPQFVWRQEGEAEDVFVAEVDLRTNEWTHIAYSYDVNTDTVVCYINGDAISTWPDAGLEPITYNQTITPFVSYAVGSARNNEFIPITTKFPGWIADVRLWDYALSASEIKSSMMTQYTTAKEGLLFNAPLNGLVNNQFVDLSGNDNYVEEKKYKEFNWIEDNSEPGAYSMIVIPDEQILSNYYPDKLNAMYQWIADNRETENIQIVMSVGDLADVCGKISDWEAVRAAWEILPDDLPFIACPGNHDYDSNPNQGNREALTLMNQYLPMSIFENYATDFGAFSRDHGLEDNVGNTWQAFEVNGNKYLILALEYLPANDVLEWADGVVSSHPNHQVIMLTHQYVNRLGDLPGVRNNNDTPSYKNNMIEVWDKFVSQHENIIMTFNGDQYCKDIVRRQDVGVHGNIVHQMLMDFQMADVWLSGAGMLGILRFNEDGTLCNISYYSPLKDKCLDEQNVFTIELPKQEQKYYAAVGTENFGSVADAIAAANGQIVEILQSTDEAIIVDEDVIIDLAGKNLSNVTVAEGYSLKLIDTAEAGSATVIGSVESLTQANGKTYVVTGENNVYTVHPYVAVLTQQVSLRDNLTMNFVVEADQDTTVNVIFAGETKKYDIGTMTADQNGKYTISVDLAAAQMTEEIKLQFVNSGVVTLEKTYSIGSYAEQILTGDYPEKTKNLVKWMLNYGAKAQLYFGVNTDNLANAGYELEAATLPTEYEPLSVNGSISGLSFYGASLVFKNKIAVRFYFTGSVEGVSFGDYEVVQKGDMHYVEVAGINPQDYSNLIALTATKGDETLTVSYSPLNYIIRMSEKGSDTLKPLLNALYGYHEAAVQYMNAINEDGYVTVDYDAVTGTFDTLADGGIYVQDGKLAVAGSGEGKVILKNGISGNKIVSVDIYPGSDNKFNSGIYLGASDAHAPQDAINAVAVIVESRFDTSDNRLDILIGNFPAWKEYYRFVIAGDAALFAENTAEPVNLQVAVEGNELTVTVSLISDPSKSVTTSHTYIGSYDLTTGQVGLRAQYDDVAFDNFKVESSQITYDFDNGDISGLKLHHSAWCNGIQTTVNDTMALHSSAAFTNGTLAASINTAGKHQAGIVFGSDEQGQSYYLFRICDNQTVELVKVVNGVTTVLDSGFLSAGHNYSKYNRIEVVKNGNTICCYYYNRFGKINCYAFYEDDAPLTGNYFGFYAANAGTKICDVTITDNVELNKAEVLIFGHSYTEMWLDYETYFPEYTDIDNIGIGGSVATHWEALADEVIPYGPKLGIYNIGINDLNIGKTPGAVVKSMENALLQIKAALPEFEVVLVSVCHCPAKPALADAISRTNALMRNLAASYDWMYYAETEYLFCTDPTDPLSTDASLFIDGLHPSAEGYQLMADVIRSAVKGENQPEFDADAAVNNGTWGFTRGAGTVTNEDGVMSIDATQIKSIYMYQDVTWDNFVLETEYSYTGEYASLIFRSNGVYNGIYHMYKNGAANRYMGWFNQSNATESLTALHHNEVSSYTYGDHIKVRITMQDNKLTIQAMIVGKDADWVTMVENYAIEDINSELVNPGTVGFFTRTDSGLKVYQFDVTNTDTGATYNLFA